MAAERRAEHRVSLAEFERMPEEDAYRLELVAGLVVREPRPLPVHGRLIVRMAYYLESYAERSGAGVVVSDSGFVLGDDPFLVRGPDIAFVCAERVPPSPYSSGFWHVAPDLVVEVLSPSERAGILRDKLEDYFAAGCRRAWILDPRNRTVTVHTPGEQPLRLAADGVLEDGRLLPGFSLPLPELFRL